eukprot:3006647-Pleurochrysis_carterae.AAC.2
MRAQGVRANADEITKAPDAGRCRVCFAADQRQRLPRLLLRARHPHGRESGPDACAQPERCRRQTPLRPQEATSLFYRSHRATAISSLRAARTGRQVAGDFVNSPDPRHRDWYCYQIVQVPDMSPNIASRWRRPRARA